MNHVYLKTLPVTKENIKKSTKPAKLVKLDF